MVVGTGERSSSSGDRLAKTLRKISRPRPTSSAIAGSAFATISK
jgi:hypothetical protein